MNTETPRKEYSPHKRARIIMRIENGESHRRIAREEGVPRGSVSGIALRYGDQEKGRSSPRSGRPQCLSDRDLRKVYRLIDQSPFISTRDLIEQAGISCCAATLRSYLQKHGIMHHRALRRPLLTPARAAERLRFARAHINNTDAEWAKWICSDETTIARGAGERGEWVWCSSVCFKTPYRIGHNFRILIASSMIACIPRTSKARLLLPSTPVCSGAHLVLVFAPLCVPWKATLRHREAALLPGLSKPALQISCLKYALPAVHSCKITLLYIMLIWSKIG